MPITKVAGRQTILTARIDFTFAELAAGAVTATTIFEALDIPGDAIVVGGALNVTEVFDSTGAVTVAIGDDGVANRYLADTSMKALGRTALVPTGYEYVAKNTIDLDVAIATDASTTGIASLEVQYIIKGRANENQD